MTITPAGYLGLLGLAALGGVVGFGVGHLIDSKDNAVRVPLAIVGAIGVPAATYAAVSSVQIGVAGAPSLPVRPPFSILLGFPRARRT